MAITNTAAGERLGVSHVHISRIRSGRGFPSQKMMLDVEAWLGWPLSEQARLRFDAEDDLAYAREFNARLDALSIDA